MTTKPNTDCVPLSAMLELAQRWHTMATHVEGESQTVAAVFQVLGTWLRVEAMQAMQFHTESVATATKGNA